MTNGMSCSRSIINGALVTAKKIAGSLLPLIMRWRVVERNREQAALLPFEMHFALFFAGGPNFGRPKAMNNVNQFFVEMMFRIERAAGRNFTDVHAGKTFHAFEINIGALPPVRCQGLRGNSVTSSTP